MESGELDEVSGEGYSHRCHPTGLDHEEQHPPVKEREQRMIGLTDVGILSANLWQPFCQLGVNECASQRDHPSCRPRARDQRGRMHLLRNYMWINENAGAD